MENLKEKTAKGLFWGALNSGMTQVLSVIIGIMLGRLLTPSEYGIVGVLTIFTAVAGALQASGFTQGLINLKAPTAKDYNSVFWFNISVSLAIYSILFAGAPLIAEFFHQPCLTDVSRLVFLCLPVSALGITFYAYMLKNMMNRELTITGLLALTISGLTGVLLALNGYSYWSLAWQQLVYIIVTNMARLYFVRWRPTLHIDFGPVRQMFGFCVKLLITNIINSLNQYLLTFVFGRLFPISAVGNYSQANKWNVMASSTISGMIGQVAQPVLVSINEERDRELRVFRKMMRFTAFLSFPAMFGLALVAREFILLTIGHQWADCIPLLQVLCVGGAFLPFFTLYQNLTISNGKSNVYMWCNIAQIVIQLILILAFYRQGVMTVVCACSLYSVLWLTAWQAIAHRLIGISLLGILKDIGPFLAVAAATILATYLLTTGITNLLLLLLARVMLAALLYGGVMKLLRVKVMDECIRFILRKN